MPIILNDNLNIQAPKSVDNRYGPYSDVSTALSSIPSTVRFQGLVIGINGSGSIVEYWFKDGILDNNLIIKVDSTANNSSANTIYIQGVDNTQNSWISSNSIYSQGVNDAQNSSIVIIQGVDNTQNVWISSNNSYFQGVNDTQNNSIVIIQGVDNTQNNWISSNTIYLSGVQTTQNTWISSNQAFTQAAYDQANTTAGGLLTANANIVVLQGVNTTQNSWISSNQAFTQAAYDQANTTAGGLLTANANTIYIQGVDNTQNSWISSNNMYSQGVNDTQNTWITANTFYQTQIGDSVNSIAVGGAPSQPASTWKTYSLVQALDTILFPTIGPSYTIPTISLSANNTGTLEIGQPINQLLTVTATKNDAGVFTQLRIAKNGTIISNNNSPSNTVTTSIGAQYGYADPNNPNYVYSAAYVDTITVPSGTTTYYGYGNYNQGQKKLNNKGATDSNAFAVLLTTNPQSANAANFTAATSSITGIYPYFWGVSSTQPTAATIAAAIAAGTATKVLAVGSGSLVVTYNASSQYLWLAVQTGYAAKTTWFNTSLNNGSIGAGQLFLSPVSQAVTSPQSYWSGVTFNIYISAYSTTTSGSITFS